MIYESSGLGDSWLSHHCVCSLHSTSFYRPSPTWARGFGSGSVRLAEAAVRHVEAQRLVAVVEAAEAAAGRRRRARGAPAVLAATKGTMES